MVLLSQNNKIHLRTDLFLLYNNLEIRLAYITNIKYTQYIEDIDVEIIVASYSPLKNSVTHHETKF
mgnify:CR=1 FL=1